MAAHALSSFLPLPENGRAVVRRNEDNAALTRHKTGVGTFCAPAGRRGTTGTPLMLVRREEGK